MNMHLLLVIALLLVPAWAGLAIEGGGPADIPQDAKKLLKGVTLYLQASVRIEGEAVVYVDPFRFDSFKKDADIVLITHSHSDHLSPADIARVARRDTVFVCPKDPRCLAAFKDKDVKTVAPGDTLEIKGVKIKAVPAYNLTKRYHPKSNAWVGYVVQFADRSFYLAGDTDKIPEMKDVKADIAFLPAGGKYTMDVKEAAKAAELIQAKYFIPYHCGGVIVGNPDDAEKFSQLCPKAVILKPVRGR